jgi:hypothetical protein
MRWVGVALICATLTSAAQAAAFVVPGWNASHQRGRSAILGKWAAVAYKKQQAALITDPGITLSIERGVLWIEQGTRIERSTWRVVEQDGDLLGLELIDAKGKRHDVDVLIEGDDALTIYVQDDEWDDDEVLRLERVL